MVAATGGEIKRECRGAPRTRAEAVAERGVFGGLL